MSFVTLTEAAERTLAAILAAPRGHCVGVLGLGVAGRAMALFLAHRGATVIGLDQRAALDDAALAAAGVRLRLGAAPDLSDLEALAIAPGADPRQPLIVDFLATDRPVFGELELAGKMPAQIIAITGTNGKSTTTALTGALVESLGMRAFVGGNLGDPVIGWLDRGTPADVAVLELSSFMLETAYHFAPDVGVVLNVTPDHLDRYADVAAYARVKEHLVRCVSPHGVVILSADDPCVRAMALAARAKVWWFSTKGTPLPGDGVSLQADRLVPQGALAAFGSVALTHPRLLGLHNRENALAAFLAVHALGLAGHSDALLSGYLGFEGLEHRLELAGVVGGVRYINDSKATNDSSAATALHAMHDPTILLAGGKDKGGGYKELVAAAATQPVRLVIAFGAAGPKIVEAFGKQGEVVLCKTMLDACQTARERARHGEVVLLSPACSSFDEFDNYTHRGRVFKGWVQGLEEGQGRS